MRNRPLFAVITLLVLALVYVRGKEPATAWFLKKILHQKIYAVLAQEPDRDGSRVIFQEFITEDGPVYHVFSSDDKARKARELGLAFPVYGIDRDFYLSVMPETSRIRINPSAPPHLTTNVAFLRRVFPNHSSKENAQTRYIPAEELKRGQKK